jgi:hypothetical protein
MLSAIFTLLLALNTIVLTMVVVSLANDDPARLPPHFGEETALGTRALVFLLAVAACWFFAQILYKQLVAERVGPAEAVGPSWGLIFYLGLFVASFAFLGVGTALWVPVLFVIVFFWSLLTVWSLVGVAATLMAVFVAVATAGGTWFLGA